MTTLTAVVSFYQNWVSVTAAQKTLVFEIHTPWVLLVHGAADPKEDEWAEYVDALRRSVDGGATGLLVLTDGGGPNPTQRKMISDVKMRTAVVTPSRVARGIVTALGWVGVDIRAYAPADALDALTFIGADEAAQSALAGRLLEMRLSLLGKSPESRHRGLAEVAQMLALPPEKL